MFNKILSFVMSLIITFGAVSAFSFSADAVDNSEKPVLLFEIDEGLGGYEFVAGCKKTNGDYDYDKMDLFLNNIYSGLSRFDSDKYTVAVHIYPTWYYKESGWNNDYSDGFQKWSPDFIYAMNFFKEKGIKVYLEYISSTVYVAQNGEEGSLPCVNINNGISDEERLVWGVPCDLQSIKALKDHYPDTFIGMRYHELIGTKMLALEGNPHACDINPEDVKYFSHKFKEYGLEVIWNDHSWRRVDEFDYWVEAVNSVSEDLGDLLTLSLANNIDNCPVIVSFKDYDDLQEKFHGVNMGYSDQAWFLDLFLLNDNKCNKYQDYPVELSAGFAQKAISKGARVVQFEPYFHLFNYTRQGINGGTDYAAGGVAMNYVTPRYEEIQSDTLDYSPRLELYRLADYLNSDTFDFENVEDFFDTKASKITDDSYYNPPVLFEQTTLCFVGENVTCLDKYNNDNTKWLEQNDYRFTSDVDLENSVAAGRISYAWGGNDCFIVVNKENGKNVGSFYNCISSLMFKDGEIFADNEDGKFLGFTCANLISEKSFRGKDTDEIIVYREKNGNINLSIYKAKTNEDGFIIVSDENSILNNFLGSVSSENFVGIYGIRSNKIIGRDDCLRSIDGLVAVYNSENEVTVKGKRTPDSKRINQTIKIDGEFACCTFADCNMDIDSADEFVIVSNNSGKSEMKICNFLTDSRLKLSKETIEIENGNIKNLFSFGRFTYQNKDELSAFQKIWKFIKDFFKNVKSFINILFQK